MDPEPTVEARELAAEVVEAPALPVAAADRTHTFAVVVGIDRYPGMGDLGGACADAQAFHDWLVHPEGGNVPPGNVHLRLSGPARTLRDACPIKAEIDGDLYELVDLARQATAPTRLYLYFSGHGIAPLQSTAAGVMADVRRDRERCWNLSFGTYLTWFERCGDFSEVVMFSDCCRSLQDAPAGAPQHDICRGGQHPHQSSLVAHAAGVQQSAFEAATGDGLIRGFFTSALIDGLRGAAAEAGSGSVHATNLAAYLESEVPTRSGGRQRPTIHATYPPLLLGGRDPTAPTTFAVSFLLPQAPTRSVEILDGDLRVVESFDTAGGSAAVPLANGLYEVRDPVGGSAYFRVEGRGQTIEVRGAAGGG